MHEGNAGQSYPEGESKAGEPSIGQSSQIASFASDLMGIEDMGY